MLTFGALYFGLCSHIIDYNYIIQSIIYKFLTQLGDAVYSSSMSSLRSWLIGHDSVSVQSHEFMCHILIISDYDSCGTSSAMRTDTCDLLSECFKSTAIVLLKKQFGHSKQINLMMGWCESTRFQVLDFFLKSASRLVPDGWVGSKSSGDRCHF